MNSVIFWLTLNIGLVAIMWIPYTLNAFKVHGVLGHMAYPTTGQLDDWAIRAKKAHANAIENIVVFASLMIICLILSSDYNISQIAELALVGKIYFISRLAHYLVYTLKIPFLRTVTFLSGFALQIHLIVFLVKTVH